MADPPSSRYDERPAWIVHGQPVPRFIENGPPGYFGCCNAVGDMGYCTRRIGHYGDHIAHLVEEGPPEEFFRWPSLHPVSMDRYIEELREIVEALS